MDPFRSFEPLADYDLSSSGILRKGSVGSADQRHKHIPFYAPQQSKKTSAEIIEEAKANMNGCRTGSFPAIDDTSQRAPVRTVNTKRPFTPRQKDRQLYYGSTNHVARPPSSFRLLPLPEEETRDTRPASSGVRLSPLSPKDLLSSFSSDDGNGDGEGSKLPKLPQLSVSPKVQSRKISKDKGKRQQFRTSSLTDVLEEKDAAEKSLDQRQTHSSPKERIVDLEDEDDHVSLIQRIHQEITGSGKTKKIFVVEEKTKTSNEPDQESTPVNSNINQPSIEPPVKEVSKKSTAENPALTQILKELKKSQEDKDDTKSKLENLVQYITNCESPKVYQKSKGEIIRTLSLYIDTDSPEILILLIQILLSINVKKQNLTTAYKLLFKVAREDSNDKYFLKGNTLELLINSIGGACPINDCEALVYGYGALKFLTMNSQTRDRLRKMGILDLVLLHLKMICEAKAERRIPDETSHVLFQLTGVLRNLVNDTSSQRYLVGMGGITQVCRCLNLFTADLDVVSNISRTLSVLSSDDEACTALANNPMFADTVINSLNKYPGRQDIVVRLTYCLGNLMAKCDQARPILCNGTISDGNNMDILLDLLQSYRKREARPPSTQVSMAMKIESEDDHGSSGDSEDVVIKIIRVVANMSINSEVGEQVAGMPEVYSHLTDILATRTIEENEELVLSTLATLNNLTYYPVEMEKKDNQDKTVFNRIEQYIDCNNVEAQIEASRVLGNLTRYQAIRDQLSESTTWHQLVNLLGSEHPDLVYTSVGVIVNMMSDFDKRQNLKKLGGIHKLIMVLRGCGGSSQDEQNWLLASLTCQAIWNYSIDSVNLFDCMDKEEISELEAILVEFLDEDTIFGSQEELANYQIVRYHEWEEFAKVGVNLLDRLESFLEPLGPMDNSDNEVYEEDDEEDSDTI